MIFGRKRKVNMLIAIPDIKPSVVVPELDIVFIIGIIIINNPKIDTKETTSNFKVLNTL
jgi:hypothetical protein